MNKIEALAFDVATLSIDRMRELTLIMSVDYPAQAERLEHLLGVAIEDRLRQSVGVLGEPQ